MMFSIQSTQPQYNSILVATRFSSPRPVGDNQARGSRLDLTTISAGRDATEAFEDVGHSDEARGYLPPMFVGDFEKDGVRFRSPPHLPVV